MHMPTKSILAPKRFSNIVRLIAKRFPNIVRLIAKRFPNIVCLIAKRFPNNVRLIAALATSWRYTVTLCAVHACL